MTLTITYHSTNQFSTFTMIGRARFATFSENLMCSDDQIHLFRVSFSFQTLISTHLPFLYSDQLFFYDSNDEWFHCTVFLFLFLSFVRSLDICVSCLLTSVKQCRLRFLATIVLRFFTFFHVWGHLEYPFVELLF